MKVKISKSKAGETRVDYIKVPDRKQFRYRLLKMIVEYSGNNALLFIDTNQGAQKSSGPGILERLHQLSIDPLVMKIPAGKEQFFGVQVNTRSKNDFEYIICLELKGRPLTQEVFDILSACDIAVGIGQIEPVVNQYGLVGVDPMLIVKTCFKNRLYDSMLCSRVNSNFDVSRFVEEITDEMGL